LARASAVAEQKPYARDVSGKELGRVGRGEKEEHDAKTAAETVPSFIREVSIRCKRCREV
jgi:hypothetical protein